MPKAQIVMLGTRGSIPVDGPGFARYGGASTSVLLRIGGETIIFDAGTGIMSAMDYLGDDKKINVFLSHPHVDHIQGLAMFPPMFDDDYTVDVYADTHMGYNTKQQIELFMREPIWPCNTDVFQPFVTLHKLPGRSLILGDVLVEWMEGNHPGGCTIFRVSFEDIVIVYCTDFEHGGKHTQRLEKFAAGCDLLIYDAQYSPEEYNKRQGFGHSTWDEGGAIGIACGAKRVLLTHHAPDRLDMEIDIIQEKLQIQFPTCAFAKCREEVYL